MAVVVDGVIKVNGVAVGTIDESQYPVAPVVDVDYDRQSVYVIK